MDKEEKTVEEELREAERRGWLRFLIPLVIVVLVLSGIAVYALHVFRKGYSRADLEASYAVQERGAARYVAFGGGFLRYSLDGASLLAADGKEKWNTSYSMTEPHLVTQGEYGAIADLAGRRVVVFSKNGVSGTYSTTSPILTLAISARGLTAVALDRGLTSLVQLFEASGNRLDIEMSFEMAMSGYPLAMALSPDGNGLVISFVSSNTGVLNSQLTFYNFSVGKNEPDRIMGFFKYDGQLLPQVNYLGAGRVVAVGDSSLEFFSLAQENKPVLLKSVELPSEISVYEAAQDHAAFLYSDPSTGKMSLRVYDSDGELCFNRETEGTFRSVSLENKGVLFLSDAGLTFWNYSGKVRYSGNLSRTGQIMFMSGSRTILQFDGSHIYRYRLK